jgi:hypothetical protein
MPPVKLCFVETGYFLCLNILFLENPQQIIGGDSTPLLTNFYIAVKIQEGLVQGPPVIQTSGSKTHIVWGSLDGNKKFETPQPIKMT